MNHDPLCPWAQLRTLSQCPKCSLIFKVREQYESIGLVDRCRAVITPPSNLWGKWRVHYVWNDCDVTTGDFAWTEAGAIRKAKKYFAKRRRKDSIESLSYTVSADDLARTR